MSTTVPLYRAITCSYYAQYMYVYIACSQFIASESGVHVYNDYRYEQLQGVIVYRTCKCITSTLMKAEKG